MVTIRTPESTTFTFDVLGRYSCNTLQEALDSQRTDHPDQGDARPFDYIIVGGGSFGAVLAARLFNLDVSHRARILVLEAGPLILSEHVQNLPPDFSPPPKEEPGSVWGVPWQPKSPKDWNNKFPGLAFCVGGRSLFWGGWSPYFIDSEVADPSWPASVVTDLTTKVLPAGSQNPTESYLDTAAQQIGTDDTNDFISGPLHTALKQRLFKGLTARAGGAAADVLTGNRGALNAEDDLEAPLAVASASPRPGMFALNKFSSVQLLFRAQRIAQAEAQAAARAETPENQGRLPEIQNSKKRLMLVDNCYVTRLERSGKRITRIHVKYRGADGQVDVPASGRVFLALGTIENTRQALVAVPEKPEIGRNLMAHLRSNLTLRVPRDSFAGLPPELQVSALFVKGIHTHPVDNSKGYYHIQITASGVGQLGMNSEAELFKKIPNIEELDQFRDLTDKWVVLTLRGIGEMVGVKSSNPQNRITPGAPDGNGVPYADVRLETNWDDPADPRITDNADPKRTKDNDLWDAMDAASEELAKIFANGGTIEYLSRPNEAGNAHWQDTPPATDLRRDTLSSTHHEAGTLWMGDDPNTSVTDPTGRIWEVDNLYVVGPALLPTIGSPNPMLSGVALTRRTADKLAPTPLAVTPEANFISLFDGTERTFQRWRSAGPGTFALQDGLLVAQPSGDQTVFFYAAETFTDYVLRLQFRLPGPVDSFGKVIGNSGVFLRFRYPHTRWPDVNAVQPLAQGNPAWVASVTGFEVQIDEQGRPDFGDKHRTGAVYGIPAGQGGEPQEQTFQAGPVLQPGTWYEFEITVTSDPAGDQYVSKVGPVQAGQPTVFTQVASFTKPADKYQNRGLAPAAGNSSGYIGLQAYISKVAFRHIRIQEK
ncbi:Choline dehydrogenase [Geodermatophilus africanus]|uniref:Choline dehydrogenase n=1 Tax=Geodermatophilus africanus TaxID=1137993 RepID=A0A1H3RCG6_9ACTN|nr:Choline dehydrogenase [Geodermatophilus africanus]